MGRRTPSYILQRRAQQAQAREQYYANKNLNDATFNATVSDIPRLRVGYRSLNLQIGATPAPAQFSILASQTAVNFFEGLADTADPTNTATRLGLEYDNLAEFVPISKFSASKIKATLGGTKVAVATDWGSRYIKYTRNAEGTARNSYTAPISVRTGAFTYSDLVTAAEAISAVAGIQTALGDNGRLWLEPESEGATVLA